MHSSRQKANTSVYVIDADFRIVYFNDTLKAGFPSLDLGAVCYRELCGNSEPCAGCPLLSTNEDKALLFNHLAQVWYEVEYSDIDWPGAGKCSIMLCRRITEGDKDLLFRLTTDLSFDELFELNLTTNQYRVLYHMEEKYTIPNREGLITELLDSSGDTLIHPDDREAYRKFWDLNTIRSHFSEDAASAKNGGALRGRFRTQQPNGGYIWVLHTVVTLPFNPGEDELIFCFVQDIQDEIADTQSAVLSTGSLEPYDQMTGLRSRASFLGEAANLIEGNPDKSYCLMAIDIEHFKLFNEWHGEDVGDRLLKEVANILFEAEKEYGAVAGYMLADDFSIVFPNAPEAIDALERKISDTVLNFSQELAFLPAFGLYAIEKPLLPISTIYDRALTALAYAKGNYAQTSIWYQASMTQGMEEDHALLSEVQRAFENDEFTFYVQPKCNIETGKVVAMESLVRWNHPEKGLITPDQFLPLLEQNGLITALDTYVWEKVFQELRSWLDTGMPSVPVSVNMSRRDMYAIDVVEKLKDLAEKYDVPTNLVAVEITESVYAEDYETMSALVDRMHAAGFAVHMDDFGSGYSSLTMLKDLTVDVLKLDMRFLDAAGEESRKGRSILESIVNMANLVDLPIIAEGVETEEQRDFLKKIGCMCAQGYLFYRPIPPVEMNKILANPQLVDFRGIQTGFVKRLQVRALLNENVLSDAMMNDILGPIVFYDVYDGKFELLRVNQQYCDLAGISPSDIEEKKFFATDFVFKEDFGALTEAFDQAQRDAPAGVSKNLRRMSFDGVVKHVHFKVFFLREHDDHRYYYGALTDITDQVTRAQQSLQQTQR